MSNRWFRLRSRSPGCGIDQEGPRLRKTPRAQQRSFLVEGFLWTPSSMSLRASGNCPHARAETSAGLSTGPAAAQGAQASAHCPPALPYPNSEASGAPLHATRRISPPPAPCLQDAWPPHLPLPWITVPSPVPPRGPAPPQQGSSAQFVAPYPPVLPPRPPPRLPPHQPSFLLR